MALGRLDLYVTFLVILAGGMTSVMLLYFLGRNQGREFFLRKNYKYFGTSDIAHMEQRLARWGALILLLSRFVVGVRSVIALVAGIGRYPTERMFVYTLVSYILFAGTVMYMAMNLVEHFETIEYYFSTYNKVVWPILILLVVGYVLRRYWATRKKGVT